MSAAILFVEHVADLRKSGLTDETISRMWCKSITADELERCVGYRPPGTLSALTIPYPELAFLRFKLFPPASNGDGHFIRYLQLKDSGVHLDVLTAVRNVFTDASIPIYFTEGEKKAAKATQEGFPCVGLGGLWNWIEPDTANGIKEFDAIVHVNREEIIVPDSDVWTRPDLLQPVYALGRELEARGACVRVVILPSRDGAKVGLDDFLVANDADAFRGLARIELKHKVFTKQAEWYKGWKAKRSDQTADTTTGQGTALTLTDPDPWPEPVNGAELLDEIANTFTCYVILPPRAADALALWVLHTFCVLSCFDSPYVSVSGPTMRCGKTRTLEVAECVVHRPLLATLMTSATLFRTIEVYAPTLLIDEKDADPHLKEELRGLLNAGNRAGARVPRCVGDNNEVRWFSVFCPKAFAGIGKLHGTTEDRSIQIRLKRRTKLESVDRFRRDRVYAACERLRRMSARWAQDSLDTLQEADPSIPDHMHDRAADCWRPLLAIADLAGGDWPKQAWAAAVTLSGDDGAAEDDVRVQILTDLRGIFGSDAKASTVAILDKLNAMADRPWPEWNHGKRLTDRGLAKLLEPFGIKSKTVRLSATETPKGYDRADFDDAFSRYIPPESATTPQPAPALEKVGVLHPPQARGCGGSKNAVLPYSDKACGGVADENGELEEGVVS